MMQPEYRAMVLADTNFVLNSWLKSYKDSAPLENIPQGIYYTEYKKTVQKRLEEGRTVMCVNPEDLDQIFGYVCFESPQVLHYIYIKYPYRKLGFAKQLYDIAGSPTIITSLPRNYKKSSGLIFNPWS